MNKGELKSERAIYSQVLAVESSQTSFLDTLQSSLSNGTNTLAKSLENELQMDGSQECKCGKETLGCSIHPNTKDEWIASMQDSLAKILALQESKLESAKKHEAACIGKSSASLTWYDQNTSSWRTYQQSLITDWELYSETWPRSATMRDGVVYELPMLAQITKETDGGCLPNNVDFFHTQNTTGMDGGSNSRKALKKRIQSWPTPTVSDNYTANLKSSQQKEGSMHSVTLAQAVKMWPTPTASQDFKPVRPLSPSEKNGTHGTMLVGAIGDQNPELVGGSLNPMFVEWLMGFPLGHTSSKDWVTPKRHSKQQ